MKECIHLALFEWMEEIKDDWLAFYWQKFNLEPTPCIIRK